MGAACEYHQSGRRFDAQALLPEFTAPAEGQRCADRHAVKHRRRIGNRHQPEAGRLQRRRLLRIPLETPRGENPRARQLAESRRTPRVVAVDVGDDHGLDPGGETSSAARFSLSTPGSAPVSNSTVCPRASTRQANPHTALTPGLVTALSPRTVNRTADLVATEGGVCPRSPGKNVRLPSEGSAEAFKNERRSNITASHPILPLAFPAQIAPQPARSEADPVLGHNGFMFPRIGYHICSRFA